MTTVTLSPETLARNVNSDIQTCKALMEQLEKERTALKERDVEQLEGIIKAKSALLEQLELSAKQRSQWLLASAFKPTGKPNETAWLALLEDISPPLTAVWQKFKQSLQKCQEENEINGRLLARNQQVFARLLAILRGQGDTQHLYNQKGNRGAGHHYQTLGEA